MIAHSKSDFTTILSMGVFERYVVISSLIQDLVGDYSDTTSVSCRLYKIKEVATSLIGLLLNNNEASEELRELCSIVDNELFVESSNCKSFLKSSFYNMTNISSGRTIKVIVYLENNLYNPEMSWINEYLPKNLNH